jgi:uncharacterized circularly permuted ATP-grasp superfamily protein
VRPHYRPLYQRLKELTPRELQQWQAYAERAVPRELIYTCQHFRREMRGVSVAK